MTKIDPTATVRMHRMDNTGRDYGLDDGTADVTPGVRRSTIGPVPGEWSTPLDTPRPATRAVTGWHRHGACVPRLDLPWIQSTATPDKIDAMREICDGCPVRVECGDEAERYGVHEGMRAGVLYRRGRPDTDNREGT